jgi:hypothetical protein
MEQDVRPVERGAARRGQLGGGAGIAGDPADDDIVVAEKNVLAV